MRTRLLFSAAIAIAALVGTANAQSYDRPVGRDPYAGRMDRDDDRYERRDRGYYPDRDDRWDLDRYRDRDDRWRHERREHERWERRERRERHERMEEMREARRRNWYW
jgi:hypothetical protein